MSTSNLTSNRMSKLPRRPASDTLIAEQYKVWNETRIYIGLCGRAQHGKSTLGRLLKDALEACGIIVETTAFAALPKTMLQLIGLTHDHLYGGLKEQPLQQLGGKTPRFAMQSLATEWGRNMLYDEIWVDAWLHSVSKYSNARVVIVEDVRHEPEVALLAQLSAAMVEVYRPDLMPKTRWEWIKYHFRKRFVHSSEQLDFKRLGIPRIVNDGTPHELLEKFLTMHPKLR